MALLRTLGAVSLSTGSNGTERYLDVQPRRLALLIFLARGGRGPFVRRDILLSHFWPDADDFHGRALLRQALSALRKQLGADAVVTGGEDEVGLAAAGVRCDAADFEAACACGRGLEAMALYGGPFLDGFHVEGLAPEFAHWVDAERDRLRRLASRAAWQASDAALGERRGDDAAQWARRAVDLEPEGEAGVARLIALLDGLGDRSGALAVYAALERRLAEEYSATPAPETRALLRALRQRPTPAGIERAALVPSGPNGGLGPAAVTAPPAPEPEKIPDTTRRRRRRFAPAGALGVVLVTASTLLFARHRVGGPASGLAVLPFRMTATDTSLAWLRHGMVDLLSIRLAGDSADEILDPTRVITAWQRDSAVAADDDDALPAVAQRVMRLLGAARAIQGSVTGDRHRLTLTAWTTLPDGQASARTQVEGPTDSLPALVDRLAIGMLLARDDMEPHRVDAGMSGSLRAVRAFLAGREALRNGRPELARQRMREAIEADSSFALAALDLARTAVWVSWSDRTEGLDVAVKHRDRLSAADRALLDALAPPPGNIDDDLARWRQLVARYPDRPEGWYILGDMYYHWGGLAGIADFAERAEEAFRRGWRLDSMSCRACAGVAEPYEHMVELAHERGDTAEVRRLGAMAFAVDSASIKARAVGWHVAAVNGPAARVAYWDRLGAAAQATTMTLVLFMTWSDRHWDDLARAQGEDMRRLWLERPEIARFAHRLTSLNAGQRSRVLPVTDWPEPLQRSALRSQVDDALFWGADTALAIAALGDLRRLQRAPVHTPVDARERSLDACSIGQWEVLLGDPREAERAIARLVGQPGPRGPATDASVTYDNFVRLCAAVLDAAVAQRHRTPAARAKLEIADGHARTLVRQLRRGGMPTANVLLAQLWEQQGDTLRALGALRRSIRVYGGASFYLSTLLREEGRLALALGDTAAAGRAWRHYLALRPDPEPYARAEVATVRAALTGLIPTATHGGDAGGVRKVLRDQPRSQTSTSTASARATCGSSPEGPPGLRSSTCRPWMSSRRLSRASWAESLAAMKTKLERNRGTAQPRRRLPRARMTLSSRTETRGWPWAP